MPKMTLHKNATTTPAIRRAFQTSSSPATVLAQQYNVHVNTVRKWRKRSDVHDLSHARHNLLSSLTPLHEEVAKELRLRLQLSLDDIVEVMKSCFSEAPTRSSIHRYFQRAGIAKLLSDANAPKHQPFEVETEPGFIHVDVKHLTRLKDKRSYVYVGIDRATRYVYAEVCYDLKQKTAAGFMERLRKHFTTYGAKVRVILTDNGFEWTDRLAGADHGYPSGYHLVDVWCAKHGVSHRLTRVRRPQTNGMVERFNRRIKEAIARQNKIKDNSGRNSFPNHPQRNRFIERFVSNYNRTRLNCLRYHSPLQMLHNHTGGNTHAGIQ